MAVFTGEKRLRPQTDIPVQNIDPEPIPQLGLTQGWVVEIRGGLNQQFNRL